MKKGLPVVLALLAFAVPAQAKTPKLPSGLFSTYSCNDDLCHRFSAEVSPRFLRLSIPAQRKVFLTVAAGLDKTAAKYESAEEAPFSRRVAFQYNGEDIIWRDDSTYVRNDEGAIVNTYTHIGDGEDYFDPDYLLALPALREINR